MLGGKSQGLVTAQHGGSAGVSTAASRSRFWNLWGQGHFRARYACFHMSVWVLSLLRPSHSPQTCICRMADLALPDWVRRVVCFYTLALPRAIYAVKPLDSYADQSLLDIFTYVYQRHFNFNVFRPAHKLVLLVQGFESMEYLFWFIGARQD